LEQLRKAGMYLGQTMTVLMCLEKTKREMNDSAETMKVSTYSVVS